MLPVLITYSNYGYIEFAKNLILNLANVLKKHKLHFYCLDEATYHELSAKPYNFLTVELFKQNVSSNFENYNTENYVKLTHTKTNVLKNALEKYSFIHFIDCDVVCLKEPTEEHYNKYFVYDIVFQYDWYFKNNVPLDLFGIWQCTGNMSLRKRYGTTNLIHRLEHEQRISKNHNDQVCLMNLFKKERIWDIRSSRFVNLMTYPPEEYANGSWKGDTSQIYFFHANHVAGKQPKIDLLKGLNQWYL
jgi:hypothetical protein